MVFNLDFANMCYFIMLLLFLINVYVLISAVITQIFNPIVELATAIGMPTKEVKTEIETHSVIA